MIEGSLKPLFLRGRAFGVVAIMRGGLQRAVCGVALGCAVFFAVLVGGGGFQAAVGIVGFADALFAPLGIVLAFAGEVA